MKRGLCEKEKHSAVRGWIKLAIIIVFFISVFFVREYVMNISIVVGASMEDTLHDGDVLLVDVGAEDIDRYDVVTLHSGEVKLIKRVIGLPGETVQIEGGKVFIDGKEIADQYAETTEDGGVAGEAYKIGEDEYFVMGDNRGNSVDSRIFGSVNIEDIIGEAFFSLRPFNKKFAK